MHNNYYFLRQISASLEKVLTGTIISECYSQSKDEVIFRFETHSGSFYLRANLSATLSLISFPQNVERARKNSVNLFGEVIGFRVVSVRQYENERSLSIILEDGKIILFKMHGNRSNAILFEKGVASVLFRNNLPADSEINPDSLDRKIDWSYEAFLPHQDEPEKLYFTFGKMVWMYLREQGFFSTTPEAKWQMIQHVRKQLEEPKYWLTPVKSSVHLTLLEFANSKPAAGDVFQVATRFFVAFTQEYVLERERTNAMAILRAKVNSGTNYCEKNLAKLLELESDSSYRQWADLIMANMHAIPPGKESVQLPDFYQPGRMIEIRLKKDLSPQANATAYYRKAKNQHIEIDRLKQSISMKQKELEETVRIADELEKITDLRELRKKVQTYGIKSVKEDQEENLPYFEFIVDGFKVWVGRNAQSNDELTLKYGYKEDLWLHAKDVPGSHVLIKYQSGKKFPKDVIERAAEIAAYNSKRKTESLCPVIVTPKKFIRKRKGDPAGVVVVEREEVILVEPKL